MGIIGVIFVYLLIPYIDIIMRAIYTVGTIVGTYTRLYSWKMVKKIQKNTKFVSFFLYILILFDIIYCCKAEGRGNDDQWYKS